jgi:hypothetical protein
MLSMPPATMIFASPDWIDIAPLAMARMPEPQIWLTA